MLTTRNLLNLAAGAPITRITSECTVSSLQKDVKTEDQS